MEGRPGPGTRSQQTLVSRCNIDTTPVYSNSFYTQRFPDTLIILQRLELSGVLVNESWTKSQKRNPMSKSFATAAAWYASQNLVNCMWRDHICLVLPRELFLLFVSWSERHYFFLVSSTFLVPEHSVRSHGPFDETWALQPKLQIISPPPKCITQTTIGKVKCFALLTSDMSALSLTFSQVSFN